MIKNPTLSLVSPKYFYWKIFGFEFSVNSSIWNFIPIGENWFKYRSINSSRKDEVLNLNVCHGGRFWNSFLFLSAFSLTETCCKFTKETFFLLLNYFHFSPLTKSQWKHPFKQPTDNFYFCLKKHYIVSKTFLEISFNFCILRTIILCHG